MLYRNKKKGSLPPALEINDKVGYSFLDFLWFCVNWGLFQLVHIVDIFAIVGVQMLAAIDMKKI